MANDSKNGFVNVELPNHSFFIPGRGVSRERLSSFFENSTDYLFLKTTANPEAVKALKDCSVKLSYCFESNYDFKQMFGTRWNQNELKNLNFNTRVADLYAESLKALAGNAFGNDYASYNLVETIKVHSLDTPKSGVYWPVIHVLKNHESSEKFKGLVGMLNSEESFNIISKMEAPQNYRMGEVKMLREKNINPLIMDDVEWRVDGENLKNAINFLVQFTLRYEYEDINDFDD